MAARMFTPEAFSDEARSAISEKFAEAAVHLSAARVAIRSAESDLVEDAGADGLNSPFLSRDISEIDELAESFAIMARSWSPKPQEG